MTKKYRRPLKWLGFFGIWFVVLHTTPPPYHASIISLFSAYIASKPVQKLMRVNPLPNHPFVQIPFGIIVFFALLIPLILLICTIGLLPSQYH